MEIIPETQANLPCQCTRVFTGDKPAIQRYCYCVDCNCTPDTGKQLCEKCAFACHCSHQIFFAGIGPCVCSCPNCKAQKPVESIQFGDVTIPCLPAGLPYRCTFEHTDKNYFIQHSYMCRTCHQKPGQGVCAVCARLCHSGHDLIDTGTNPFYCDCGSDGISDFKCKCVKEEKNDENDAIDLPFEIPFQCTSKFTLNKVYTQRGFACKTCGVSEDHPICEVCAIKCHSGHELVDLKLKPFCCNSCPDCKCKDGETKEMFVPSLCAPEPEENCCCCCDCEYDEEEEEEEGHEGHHHHHHCQCEHQCEHHCQCEHQCEHQCENHCQCEHQCECKDGCNGHCCHENNH